MVKERQSLIHTSVLVYICIHHSGSMHLITCYYCVILSEGLYIIRRDPLEQSNKQSNTCILNVLRSHAEAALCCAFRIFSSLFFALTAVTIYGDTLAVILITDNNYSQQAHSHQSR